MSVKLHRSARRNEPASMMGAAAGEEGDAAGEEGDATTEVDDAATEVADAATELADAATELADAATELADAAMRLSAVSKEYEGDVCALRQVSVAISRGDQVAVVGPSGSGKTTMLTILGTLERPTSGSVRVAGRDVVSASDAELAGLRAHQIGFVFQSFHLQDSMTAVDNVANGMLYTGVPLGERREMAAAALELVGLGHRLTHRPQQLSGGERQRVAIARALAKRPVIILADEPTGNLDSKSGGEVLELLHELASDGATLVLITHDEHIADGFPRRIQMRDGEIMGDERR